MCFLAVPRWEKGVSFHFGALLSKLSVAGHVEHVRPVFSILRLKNDKKREFDVDFGCADCGK